MPEWVVIRVTRDSLTLRGIPFLRYARGKRAHAEEKRPKTRPSNDLVG